MAKRHLWEHEPRGYGWSCRSQCYGTGCTQLATWRHATAPAPQQAATYWCERHKSMAEGSWPGPPALNGVDVICYHTTAAAEAILRDGFRDATGSYMFANSVKEFATGHTELIGVWLGDSPMTINEGGTGDQVLRVEFVDDVDLDDFEVVEEHKPYHEWCVPAALINARATVTLMSDDFGP